MRMALIGGLGWQGVLATMMAMTLGAALLGCSTPESAATSGATTTETPDGAADAIKAATDTAGADTVVADVTSSDVMSSDVTSSDVTSSDVTSSDVTSSDGTTTDTTTSTDSGAPCKSDFVSALDMPGGSKIVDFESCNACACCNADGTFPKQGVDLACKQCAPNAALAAVGGTLQGGLLTSFVSCITGNKAAPIKGRAVFVGTSQQSSAGKPALIMTFNPPVALFGLSAVATSSTSQPHVVLRGYDGTGKLVAQDSFDFTGKPGGACATTNPAVQFFGFRPCGVDSMTRVVIETSDANLAIDNVMVWRP